VPPRAIGVRDLAGEPERTAVAEQRIDSEVLDQELVSQRPHGPRMPEDVVEFRVSVEGAGRDVGSQLF